MVPTTIHPARQTPALSLLPLYRRYARQTAQLALCKAERLAQVATDGDNDGAWDLALLGASFALSILLPHGL